MTHTTQRNIAIAVTVFGGLAAIYLAPAEKPRTAPSNAGFSAVLPGEVTQSVRTIKGKSGPFPLHLYQSTLDIDRCVFTVAHQDIAGASLDPRSYLNSIVPTIIGKDRLILKKEYLQDGFPAIEVRTAAMDGIAVKRIVVANGRFYQVEFWMRQNALWQWRGDSLPEESRAYFKSFRIEPERQTLVQDGGNRRAAVGPL